MDARTRQPHARSVSSRGAFPIGQFAATERIVGLPIHRRRDEEASPCCMCLALTVPRSRIAREPSLPAYDDCRRERSQSAGNARCESIIGGRILMDTGRIIDKLNDILRWEWKGVVQYTQASFLVQDLWRETFSPLFRKGAEESLSHAQRIGDKIVALGGMPTIERAEVHQSHDLREMLHHALELERGAVEHYTEALELCENNAGLRLLLEEILLEEQDGADHLEKLLGGFESVGASHEMRGVKAR